eukprot:EG_transcript_9753
MTAPAPSKAPTSPGWLLCGAAFLGYAVVALAPPSGRMRARVSQPNAPSLRQALHHPSPLRAALLPPPLWPARHRQTPPGNGGPTAATNAVLGVAALWSLPAALGYLLTWAVQRHRRRWAPPCPAPPPGESYPIPWSVAMNSHPRTLFAALSLCAFRPPPGPGALSLAQWRLAPRGVRPHSTSLLHATRGRRNTATLLPPPAPEHAGKYTVVLDMDETLLRTLLKRPKKAIPSLPWHQLDFGDDQPLFTTVRPGAASLVASLTPHCEVVLWTAGEREYAQRAMRYIDPAGAIHHNVYRSPAWYSEEWYVKDLERLGRPLDRVVLVDNTAAVCVQRKHAIVVEDFVRRSGDDLLPRLETVLKGLLASNLTVPEYLAACVRQGSLTRRSRTGFFRMSASSKPEK